MLNLLSKVYGLGVRLRNAAYDRGIFASHALGARTISVGNLTAGGTGKTPLVAAIARMLADRNETVCILSRGYRRRDPGRRVLVSDGQAVLADASVAGDEPVEIARKLIGQALVVVDGDRVGAARWALDRFGVTAFVLDDGFQHRRAKRDLDIVCIDATNPFGGEKLLPTGMLREPPAGLARADALIITRSDLVKDLSELDAQLARLAPGVHVFRSTTALVSLISLAEFGGPADRSDRAERSRPTVPLFAFCGLGNPAGFFSQVERDGLKVVGTKAFPDHHPYSQKDIDDLHRVAADEGAGTLVTTAKDAVKLAGLEFRMPCLVAEIEARVDEVSRFAELIVS